jgi:hypothetical protein
VISGISGNNPLRGSRSTHFGHDHGLVRLHNHELVVEALASVQAKILTIFWVLPEAAAISGRRKTDLDPRIWFLRVHDYGLGWLHIHELVIDLFHGFQGKFLKIFRR